MGWWQQFKEQASEILQQILYALELATALGDDAPWIDTLNFLWDSLPDADKLTTAERRRLAHSMKQMVREQVHKHYAHELAHKEAISKRQASREALAQKHLQQLADQRQQQMRQLSEVARQQSLILPSDAEIQMLLSANQPWPLLPRRSQEWQWQWQHSAQQQQQQGSPSRVQVVNHGQGQRRYHVVRRSLSVGSGSAMQRPSSGHLAITIQSSSSGEIEPAFGDTAAQNVGGRRVGLNVSTSMNSGDVSSNTANEELQQPLLSPPQSPFAAPQQQQVDWWDVQQQQQPADQFEVHKQYLPPNAVAITVDQLALQTQQQMQHDAVRSLGRTFSKSCPSGLNIAVSGPPQQCQPCQQPSAARPDTDEQLQLQTTPCARTGHNAVGHSGSQLLLQRYFSSSSPTSSGVDTGAVTAAEGALMGLCAEGGAAHGGCCECGTVLVESVSEPPSECSAAASSAVDQYSSSSGCGHVNERRCSACSSRRSFEQQAWDVQKAPRLVASAGATAQVQAVLL